MAKHFWYILEINWNKQSIGVAMIQKCTICDASWGMLCQSHTELSHFSFAQFNELAMLTSHSRSWDLALRSRNNYCRACTYSSPCCKSTEVNLCNSYQVAHKIHWHTTSLAIPLGAVVVSWPQRVLECLLHNTAIMLLWLWSLTLFQLCFAYFHRTSL